MLRKIHPAIEFLTNSTRDDSCINPGRGIREIAKRGGISPFLVEAVLCLYAGVGVTDHRGGCLERTCYATEMGLCLVEIRLRVLRTSFQGPQDFGILEQLA